MSIVEKLNKIETKNILVIGDVMLDRYFFGISKRISPEAPVPVLLKQSERIVLGGAANVADDVYDGVFKNLVIKDENGKVCDNRLHGLYKLADVIATGFNRMLNWFITNL